MNSAEILDQLNTYEGENIWQDVVYDVADADATDALGCEDSTEFIAEDGTHFVYAMERQMWAVAE